MMKLLIRYLSLLLYSGLIVPLYIHLTSPVKTWVKPVILQTIATSVKTDYINSFFYTDVIKNLFPVLKNSN